jgi:ribosome assembly protein YihI (activator of Der GTPase)
MRVARIDELMDELNKLVYDSMISAMQKAAPEEWETAPTMMVDLKVPDELDNNPTFSEGPLYVEDMLVRLDTLMDELRPLLKEAMKK